MNSHTELHEIIRTTLKDYNLDIKDIWKLCDAIIDQHEDYYNAKRKLDKIKASVAVLRHELFD